jgi:mediator of RNA polymerase II transcription subunit 17
MDLNATLRNAQVEITNQEIFSFLVAEAGNLPTASVQVAERLVIINAAQGLDLTFELVKYSLNFTERKSNSTCSQIDDISTLASTVNSENGDNLSELIYHVLHVLLLRKHHTPTDKSQNSSKTQERVPSILQPIIDVLQYQVFCQRILCELRRAVNALNDARIPSTLSFTAVGESGERLVSLLTGDGEKSVGGEAIIRIDNRWIFFWLIEHAFPDMTYQTYNTIHHGFTIHANRTFTAGNAFYLVPAAAYAAVDGRNRQVFITENLHHWS